VVSKESFIGDRWNSPGDWYGAVNDRVPIEAGMHNLMPEHGNVIRYLGFNVQKRLKMVRIYTEFAELGDLAELWITHTDLSMATDQGGNPLQAHIPLVAILCLFEAMAAGLCLMAHGTVPQDNGLWPGGLEQAPQWVHEIVHRDIKPLNYFLSSSSKSGAWPDLPVAALGDFGNAVDALDQVNILAPPKTLRGMGTLGFQAPEQQMNAPNNRPVTAATNVYQVGISMLQLMNLQKATYERKYDVREDMNHRIFPRPRETPYPRQLVDLAWECISMHPETRPAPGSLYLQIRKMAMEYPDGGSHNVPLRKSTWERCYFDGLTLTIMLC
jgi:serine/threonine protein kinase